MKSIEIIGLPGSGKSTLSNQLYLELPSLFSSQKAFLYSYLKYSDLNLFFKLFFSSENYFNNKIYYFFSKFIEKTSSYLPTKYNPFEYSKSEADLIIKLIPFSSLTKNSSTINAFKKGILKQLLNLEYFPNKYILIDEGPYKYFQSLFNFDSYIPNIYVLIEKLFNHLPPIKAFIIFEPKDIDLSLSRIYSRNSGPPSNFRYISRQKALSILEFEAYIINAICKVAIKKKIPYLLLDSTKDFKININKSKMFILQLINK